MNPSVWQAFIAVPDGIPSPQSNPLRDRAVLLLRFRELLLRPERLVGLYHKCQWNYAAICMLDPTYRHLDVCRGVFFVMSEG